jgi:hypothetical protein
VLLRYGPYGAIVYAVLRTGVAGYEHLSSLVECIALIGLLLLECRAFHENFSDGFSL